MLSKVLTTVIPSYRWFCLTNSPNPKDMYSDEKLKETKQIITMKERETVIVWPFLLKK